MPKLINNSTVFLTKASTGANSLNTLLNKTNLISKIPKNMDIIIKPNLVNDNPPPVTTPVDLIEKLILFLKTKLPENKLIVAEGTATPSMSTGDIFKKLNYLKLAHKYNIELIDLNEEDSVKLTNPTCQRLPEIYLPKLIMNAFLISVPVLKAHALSEVTLTMKNMMGVLPPKYYREDMSWNKSAMHYRIHEAIFDLNRYRKPDFSIIDATIGLRDSHLWGAFCEPKPDLLLAGFDPVAIDAIGCLILKHPWERVNHIRMANGVIGNINLDNKIRV